MKVFLILLVSIKLIDSKITLDIDPEHLESIKYSGVETSVATDSDIKLFFAEKSLKDSAALYYGRKPTSVYYKSPTPWGDLYDSYKWEQVKRVTLVKSMTLRSSNKKPVTVFTKNFENNTNKTMKVNTGISYTVENTMSTTWSKGGEVTVSQEIGFDIKIITTNTGVSYTSTWGRDEEQTHTVVIGSTSSMETELQPGQKITAVLSVTHETFDIDVTYKTSLRGILVVNFKKPHNGHRFWGPQIQDVMREAGISNDRIYVQTIRFGYNVNDTLKFIDAVTGEML